MAAFEELLLRVLYYQVPRHLLTQEVPVLPDVWLTYAAESSPGTGGDRPLDLLLTPASDGTPGDLFTTVRRQIQTFYALADTPNRQFRSGVAHNDSFVVGRFTFMELLCVLLPLSDWFQNEIVRAVGSEFFYMDVSSWDDTLAHAFRQKMETCTAPLCQLLEAPFTKHATTGDQLLSLAWLARVAGLVARIRAGDEPPADLWRSEFSGELRVDEVRKTVDAFIAIIRHAVLPSRDMLHLSLINCNRRAQLAMWRSRVTVKADVAERSMDLDFTGLRWAIIDSGIDATHPAFLRPEPPTEAHSAERPWYQRTRIIETYDFTRLRRLLEHEPDDESLEGADEGPLSNLSEDQLQMIGQLQNDLLNGRSINWDIVKPLLLVPHSEMYEPPQGEHGTHVAGILASDWPATAGSAHVRGLRGICPTLELYDLRVFDTNGQCDEFSVIGALNFIRFLNSRANELVIQGVNMSISMDANPAYGACGQTPVCRESERLVRNGVVVVVPAGNLGYRSTVSRLAETPFSTVSITDPGNADEVITVGSTHPSQPHTYGVSFFSGRGPTADGRRKPDLVAPGETVESTTPGASWGRMNGTSMAAPHVSGAAAVLMARSSELIGRPARIKRILMETATDLGREPGFQGAGLVDIARALSSL